MPTYCQVAVALPVHEPFTYSVPPALLGSLSMGHAVLVPFGPRKITGYVLAAGPDVPPPPKGKARPVERLLDPQPAFDATQLSFFRWIADYYRSGLGEVISTALPAKLKATTRTVHLATEEGVDALAAGMGEGHSGEVLREVIQRPKLTRRGLQRRMRELMEPKECAHAIDALLRKGWIEAEQLESGGVGGTENWWVQEVPVEQAAKLMKRMGARQLAVLECIAAAGGAISASVLAADQGPYARTAAKAMLAAGVLSQEVRERRDAVVAGELPESRGAPTLTAAQQGAVDTILGPPKPHLLYGVTGAGKTEVYLRAAASILERDKQVLLLVPEIGLTPLLTGRFRARFGDAVAVLHSGLTPAQKLREWRRIRAGEARVAVGARSALFAPFVNLGLLIVDEEHDDSYKQDDGVRYNARDLAIVRGHMAECPVVMGSATPSLESWHNAQTGRYGLIQLLERPTPRPVPKVELIDMTQEPKEPDGRRPIVARSVHRALKECFAAGGQAIVLYNRRGFATLVECEDCGASYSCPSCGVSLVLHQHKRTLSCHYCGFHRKMANDCGACGGTLQIMGKGTERIEQVMAEMFPEIPVSRMDADTTAARGAHFEILDAFRRGKTRLLVGTQIVAKGHDFPDVSLAVVLGADHVLRMPDFRAAERSFSLLTQLGGRAGRGDRPGRMLVQTSQKDHYVFGLLGDYATFATEELKHRDLLRYPPIARLGLIRIEGSIQNQALEASWTLLRRLRATCDGKIIEVQGPAQAAMPRLVGRWRYQILLRGNEPRAFRKWLRTIDLSGIGKGVRVSLDVDPRHLM